MLDPRTWLFVLIVFAAFVVESAAGFGATVVTVTLAAFLFPLDVVLAILLPANMALSGYMTLRYRHFVDRDVLFRRILPLMGLGLVGGLALARLEKASWLKLVFAAFVVLLAARELVPKKEPPPAASPTSGHKRTALTLISAGVVHGIFACGGPLVVYYAGRTLPDKARFRATLSALWLLLNAIVFASLVARGTVHAGTLAISALLVVPLVLGITVGERVHARVSEARFRRGVFVLLLVAGLVLLGRTYFYE
jgi:uncharacterized membrane protein YfcA